MKRILRLGAAAAAVTLALGAAGGTHPVKAASAVTISPNDTYAANDGVFQGWGTSLCWWANRVGYSDSLAQQTADAFYGEDGLRLNIARFNIGGGDDPSHTHITRTDSNMPGYSRLEDGQIVYDWSADANQRNVLLRCVQAAGDDMITEMFSNSPPYYMTKSGCSSGGTNPGENNLKDDSYTAFAEYLAEVCAHYENEWGVDIQSIAPMNEPYTNYWGAYSNKQEGCHFDIGESESRVITELRKSLAARGLGDILISGTDETSIDTAIDAFSALSDEAKAAISRIDTHTYGGSRRNDLRDTAKAAGKNLWMSEVDSGGVSGTDAGEMGAALWLAERITADCNGLEPSAWVLWQVIDNHISTEGYNGNKDKGMVDVNGGYWGVAVADHDNDSLILTKKYYAFGQYSRYIRPGMTMLRSSGPVMAALDKETGELVLVAYNTDGTEKDLTVDLSQFDTVGTLARAVRTSGSENWADAGETAIENYALNAKLPANSVTTFLVSDVSGGFDPGERIEPAEVTGSDSWHADPANGADKAFDGDLTTYFDGVGEGYVQADLGGLYALSAIGFCPRKGYEYRMADSVFQVSSDGENWETVYTVMGKPDYSMHLVRPSAQTRARYVRYTVPAGKPQNEYNGDDIYCCNIAEIELYGTPALLMGDVGADGNVTAADAVALQKYLLRQETELASPQAADFNGDGILTAADLSALKRLLLSSPS